MFVHIFSYLAAAQIRGGGAGGKNIFLHHIFLINICSCLAAAQMRAGGAGGGQGVTQAARGQVRV